MAIPTKSPRGFQAIDAARRREIASMGGKAAHQSGSAHQFTSEEAKAAGRKSAVVRAANRLAKKQQGTA